MSLVSTEADKEPIGPDLFKAKLLLGGYTYCHVQAHNTHLAVRLCISKSTLAVGWCRELSTASAWNEHQTTTDCHTRQQQSFCCVQERNPEALLQPFMSTMAAKGLGFQQALFVPPESSYRKLGVQEQQADLSWQHQLQHIYQTTCKGVS